MKDIIVEYCKKILIPIVLVPLLGIIVTICNDNIHFIYSGIILFIVVTATFIIYRLINEHWNKFLPYSIENVFSKINYIQNGRFLNASVETIYTIKGTTNRATNIVIHHDIIGNFFSFFEETKKDWEEIETVRETEQQITRGETSLGKVIQLKISNTQSQSRYCCCFYLKQPLMNGEELKIKIINQVKIDISKNKREFVHRSALGVKKMELIVNISNNSSIKNVSSVARCANNPMLLIQHLLDSKIRFIRDTEASLVIKNPIPSFDYGLVYFLSLGDFEVDNSEC